jgi:predicted NACHT family NTPase
MTKRSLAASKSGQEKAKKAFERKGWTQEYLAGEVGLETRQSIWKFFSGRPIERHIFIDICHSLDLDWEEIAYPSGESLATETDSIPQNSLNTLDIDILVAEARSRSTEPILAQCSTINLLETGHPVPLENIYVNQKIHPQLRGQSWLDISDLNGGVSASKSPELMTFDRLDVSLENSLSPPKKPAIAAVETYPKLLILGKPGSGKTTLLKYLSLRAIRQELESSPIPFFISIRSWAQEVNKTEELSLLTYLHNKYNELGVSRPQLELLLKQGKILILLDGLDEVNTDTRSRVIQEITSFAETYYQNQIIITCRLGALNYHISGFTSIELADFTQDDIEIFAQKWFVVAAGNNPEIGLKKATKFMENLALPENQSLRELGITPILLNLLVSVFQTLKVFPSKRSKLYEVGLAIFLVRWDESRLIKRDEVYRNLSVTQKMKLLSQIAFSTFESGNYFFEESEAIEYISDYLANLSEGNLEPEMVRQESEAILKSIEMQHGLLVERAQGIYSFSHLTFQEYLTARYLANIPDSGMLNATLGRVSVYVHDQQWREVFLLLVDLLRNAETLLTAMKYQVDLLLRTDNKLTEIMLAITKKCNNLKVPYKQAALRGFYLTLLLDMDLNLPIALDSRLGGDLAPQLKIDLSLIRLVSRVTNFLQKPDHQQVLSLSFALDIDNIFSKNTILQKAFQLLKAELPDPENGQEFILPWWESEGEKWKDKLIDLIFEYRKIPVNYQLSPSQKTLLKQYYQGNLLLVNCWQTECRCSPMFRQNLEETLLSPAVRF